MKKSIGILLFMVIMTSAMIVGATILGFYLQLTPTVTVDNLITFDGQPAEELITTEDFNTIPGTTTTFNHTVESEENLEIFFTWTNETGITTTVLYLGNPVNQLTLVAGVEYDIQTQYIVDSMAKSGTYNTSLEITT